MILKLIFIYFSFLFKITNNKLLQFHNKNYFLKVFFVFFVFIEISLIDFYLSIYFILSELIINKKIKFYHGWNFYLASLFIKLSFSSSTVFFIFFTCTRIKLNFHMIQLPLIFMFIIMKWNLQIIKDTYKMDNITFKMVK